jgi:hypothetical protein
MKLKLGIAIAVLFAVGLLVSPACGQDQPAQKTTRDTVSNNTTPDSSASTANGTPEIFFADSTYDFGEVSQRQDLTHIFKVQNIGDAPLKLISARAS